MKEYYETRAPEYDDWYLGRGLFDGRDPPGWDEELAALFTVIEALPRGRTLDVACGIGHNDVDEQMSPRILNDGSRWEVFKRYFTGTGLAEELGGGEVLHDGEWFVVVRAA